MEGFQGRLNASIRFKLSFFLSLAVLLAAILAGALSFLSAFHEAHDLQDDLLRQVAQLLDRQHLSGLPPDADPRSRAGDEEARVIVQRLDDPGAVRPGGVDTGGRLALPATLADGLQTLEIDGESFRVMVRTTSIRERIAVAQEAGFRNGIARDGAFRTVLPLLLLAPVLLVLVTGLVRAMFLPITALSEEVDRRSERDLHPVADQGLPAEVRPFAVAINRLLTRIAQSMESQRRFIADAAHELRSPLTALSLQAERLAAADMSGEARERLHALRQGIDRGKSLLEQLLALARAQAEPAAAPESPVSIQRIYRRVLEDLMPLAEAKAMDIGVEGTQDARVQVNEIDLIAVVRNLTDNAIRYTPAGGRIDLSVIATEDGVILRIADNGPGIAVAERERVFAPFYRTLGTGEEGSGLGLSIVRTVARRMGAQVRLDFTEPSRQTGLCVELLIPAAIVGS